MGTVWDWDGGEFIGMGELQKEPNPPREISPQGREGCEGCACENAE